MCLNVRDEQEPQFQRAPRACRVMPSPACSDAAHVCQAVAGMSASVIVGAARHRVPPTAEAGQSVRLHGHGTPAPCHAGACPYGGTPRHALARPGTAVKTLTAPGTLRPRRARLGHDARFHSATRCARGACPARAGDREETRRPHNQGRLGTTLCNRNRRGIGVELAWYRRGIGVEVRRRGHASATASATFFHAWKKRGGIAPSTHMYI